MVLKILLNHCFTYGFTFTSILLITVQSSPPLGAYQSLPGVKSIADDCDACRYGLQLLSLRERRSCCQNGFIQCCPSAPLSAPFYPEERPEHLSVDLPSSGPSKSSDPELSSVTPDSTVDQALRPDNNRHSKLNRFGPFWPLNNPFIHGIVAPILSSILKRKTSTQTNPRDEKSSDYIQNLNRKEIDKYGETESSSEPTPFKNQGEGLGGHGNSEKYLNSDVSSKNNQTGNDERSQGKERKVVESSVNKDHNNNGDTIIPDRQLKSQPTLYLGESIEDVTAPTHL